MTRAMQVPVVSVVIPCYNQAHFLGIAIESVVSQDPRAEVVVVDDGSTDDTGRVASSYAGVVCLRQENRGLAAARNSGFTASRGALVIFLDADDCLLPGGIAAGVEALRGRPDCAMAYGRCVMMGPDGSQWPTPRLPVLDAGHHAAFLRSNPIWMPGAAILRREAFDRAGGFAAGFDAAADYDLYLRITREAPVHDHGLLVAAYRQHPASMSGSAARMLRETLTVMRRHRARAGGVLAPAWREGRRNWQGFYGTRLVEEIRRHVRAGELWPALRKTATLARLAPWVLRHELARKAAVVAAAARTAL
jgi:glycosyltransferase involved in cell wall biosynthesis